MEFAEHGSFESTRAGNVLKVCCRGSFNAETSTRYVSNVQQFIDELGPERFAIILDLTDLEGATPEAWDIASEANELLAKNLYLIGKAIICKSTNIEYFAEKINRSSLHDKFRVFLNESEALTWIRSEISTQPNSPQ